MNWLVFSQPYLVGSRWCYSAASVCLSSSIRHYVSWL